MARASLSAFSDNRSTSPLLMADDRQVECQGVAGTEVFVNPISGQRREEGER